MSKGWWAVDMDGTLAVHESGSGVDTIGEPIGPMIQQVHKLLDQGYEVRIFTARVWCPQDERWTKERAQEAGRQRIMVMDWCEKHIGKRLKVTCEKDYEMVGLIDDRAYRVIKNTGQIVV